MLKKRIIPVVQYDGMTAVMGRKFQRWRSIGSVRQQVEIWQARGVDELMLLDVGATPQGREPNFELIADLCSGCFMPMTVGGGMRTVEHFRLALRAGADKIAVGGAAFELGHIWNAAKKFGAQAVTVILNDFDGWIWSSSKARPSGLGTVDAARHAQRWGAGEIVLNSVTRDGMMDGYDLAMVKTIADEVNIPVVALGGAGTYEHFLEAFQAGAHAVAAGAMFAYTDARPREAAEYLAARGVPTRLD